MNYNKNQCCLFFIVFNTNININSCTKGVAPITLPLVRVNILSAMPSLGVTIAQTPYN